MNINKKIIVFSLSGLLLMGIISLIMSIHSLGKRGEEEIASIKTMMMKEKKEKLKDLVKNTYAIMESSYNAAHDSQKVAEAYKDKLKNIVDITYNAMKSIDSRSDLTANQKKQSALNIIKDMRYNNNDYIWINDMHPTMVMHPIKPALNGKNLSDFKDPNGKHLFNEFVEVCREKGEGFVDYMWPKPGYDKPVPKLSYVKLFKPWNWIVGTGIYLDDIKAAEIQKTKEIKSAIASQRNELIGIIIILFVLGAGVITYISLKITIPIKHAGEMLKDIAQGEGDLTKRPEYRLSFIVLSAHITVLS